MRCVEIVTWKPRRRAAANREPTKQVLGVTNYDKCQNTYWLITEVDKKIDVERFFEAPVRPLLIVETRKGYHVYWDYRSGNPLKVYHYGMKHLVKLGVADKHHLKLARARGASENELYWKLVLRVSPKYNQPDLFPIYISENLPEWHTEVLLLIMGAWRWYMRD